MSKVREVIRHVTVEMTRGERSCRRNRKHRIAVGQPCLVIQEQGTPFKKSYCAECALPILRQCAADLRKIRDTLYGPNFDGKKPTLQAVSLGEQLVESNRKRVRSSPQMQVTGYVEESSAATESYESGPYEPQPNNVVPIYSQARKFYESQ